MSPFKKVLVVDDDSMDLRLAVRSLRDSAIDIISCNNSVAANEHMKNEDFDCVLLDYNFPTGTAFDLFADTFSKTCLERPPIVLLTGVDDPKVAARSIQLGAQEYLCKVDLSTTSVRLAMTSACEKAMSDRMLARKEQELTKLSLFDSLTGLANRRLFFDRFEQVVKTDGRTKETFAIMVLDLDQFKMVNDSFGHDMGDSLLRDVGARMKNLVRDSDTVARLGGDEFAVLLPTAKDQEGAIHVAEKIRSELTRPFIFENQSICIGSSIGIAVYPEHGRSTGTLFRLADQAMFEAKRNGDGVVVSDGRIKKRTDGTENITDSLHGSMHDKGLFVAYQPQIRMTDGQVCGAEALVRWNHPTAGLLFPDKFIPAAERSGLIEALTSFVLGEIVKMLSQWSEVRKDFVVAINVAAPVLDSPGAIDRLHEVLNESGVSAENICLEVTETGIMRSPQVARGQLQRAKDLGFRVSIDDFGTGYSSLKYLRDFPIDEIKIDREFVNGIIENERDELVVKSVLALGDAFDVDVVAEGIETSHSLSCLADWGCDLGQGYFISKPVEPEQISDLLLRAAA